MATTLAIAARFPSYSFRRQLDGELGSREGEREREREREREVY
jgi:hypothetical protein